MTWLSHRFRSVSIYDSTKQPSSFVTHSSVAYVDGTHKAGGGPVPVRPAELKPIEERTCLDPDQQATPAPHLQVSETPPKFGQRKQQRCLHKRLARSDLAPFLQVRTSLVKEIDAQSISLLAGIPTISPTFLQFRARKSAILRQLIDSLTWPTARQTHGRMRLTIRICPSKLNRV